MTAILDWLNTPVFFSFGAPTSWAEVLGFFTLCVIGLIKWKRSLEEECLSQA